MIKSFQSALSPLLIISCVCGLKTFEFPTGHPKLWCSLLYILLFWAIYFLLVTYILSIMIPYYVDLAYSLYTIFFLLNICILLISVVLMVYYDKKFRKCLKRIAIVDDTLAQLGITTNYQKLRKRTTWLILGWFMSIIVLNSGETLWLRQYNLNTLIVICVPYIQNYCYHINFVDDLIIISILGYIGLKFDQINENVQKIMKNNKHKIRQVGKNRMLQSRQRRLSRTPSKKHVLWIVIHLHLELCKISREINSIFGIQMTLKMGLYFGFITANLCEIFDVILIENYCKLKVEFFVLLSLWIVFHVLKLFFINYVCEKVSAKASTTGNVINIASYSICDVEIRENILQFLLQLTQAPLRFYGLGLFQFGFKFLQGFLSSVATVIIILIQAHVNK